ncbi:MAG TPA: glycosyltransferase family 1 protein [Patescibacteria group bacterium]|nr:glycosyltransferase family 1 protein [Patescibacteria group bacterium]
MIIGIDASRANSRQRTGTEWYSFHVIEELKKIIPAEHQVILYSKEPLLPDLSKLPVTWQSRVLRWPPKFLWTQFRLSWEMFMHKPDILYIPAHTIPLIHPKKIVLVVHDVGFEREATLYNDTTIGNNQPIVKKIMNLLVRLVTVGKYNASEKDYHRFAMTQAIRHATRIITVSQFSQQEIIDVYHSVSKKRITVIPNGFNTRKKQQITKISSTIVHEHGIRMPYVLFIGRIEQKKNIPRLIDAFALIKKQYHFSGQLVLAGSPGFGHEEVQHRITKHQLSNDVIQTGWISNELLSLLLTHAHAFVFPSLYEGFGIPLLEAMSVGVPTVCSAISPLQEIGSDATLYFNPTSSEDMAEKIAQVLYKDSLRQTLIEKGYAQACKFSWENTALKTWNVLHSIMQKNL